jgi:hypothetical protein
LKNSQNSIKSSHNHQKNSQNTIKSSQNHKKNSQNFFQAKYRPEIVELFVKTR